MKRASTMWILVALICCLGWGTANAAKYAVLISTGETTADNVIFNSEYWYDLLLAYEMLMDNGYDHDSVFVLYGEGLPFESSYERYQNPYPENFVDYNNHKATIQSVLGSLNDTITADDQLFVWWLGRGEQEDNHLQLFIENTGESLLDTEFAEYMSQIEQYALRVFSFMTSHSGGIINDLQGPNTIVTTSAAFYAMSYSAYFCDAIHSEFHYYETCAYQWQTPFGMCGAVDADQDANARISFREAFDYAAAGTQSPAVISDPSNLAPISYLTNLAVLCLGLEIDDDDQGASEGNGNQIVEYSETIELSMTLQNLSAEDLTAVEGVLTCNDEHVTLLVDTAGFGDIPAYGGIATNQDPAVFATDGSISDGHTIELELTLNNPPGTVIDLTVPVQAPELQVVAYTIDDGAGGDGDGLPESGETVTLTATIQNTGSVSIDEAQVSCGGDPYLNPAAGTLELGTLHPGATREAGPLTLVIDDATPELYTGTLTAIMRGIRDYRHVQIVSFNVGDLFQADMETSAGWSHYIASEGFGDQWIWTNFRNHTYDGVHSWKCGHVFYADNLHAALESSPFTLPAHCRLTMWHWMDAEISNVFLGYCYDGGLVEISIEGGEWEQITPDGGYPYLARAIGGPFPEDTPLFSGHHDWKQETFDLSNYAGSARLRFVFGSDGGGADPLEGWFVDDVVLEMEAFSSIDLPPVSARIQLHPASPNPARENTQLRFELPAAGQVTAQVYEVSGRCVRRLLSDNLTAGAYAIDWDGRDDAGRTVDSGVYWIRVVTGNQSEEVRLMRVR